jgi:MiaB-like tRNA modifying enzyme
MTTVHSEVYGCPSNIADFEMALGLLKQAGFEIANETASSPEEADLNIIFTCVVKTPTEKRMIQKMQELAKTGKPLIVAGCMPKTSQRAIERINPDASMVGPHTLQNIVDVAKKTLTGEKVILVDALKSPKICLPRIRKNKSVGIVTISTGCNQNCSYCCVRFARGKLLCYPVGEIVAGVAQAIKEGCNEIWVTSQDNGSYDFNGVKFPQLLSKICKVSGDFRIRVGMMNPTYVKNKNMLDDLIEAYKNEKVRKFLHLPVQSGSDKILRAMKRGYAVKDFVEIVERFRKEIPGLFLSTDIIVGFPSETEKDFEATVALLEKTKPGKVNVSKFGARPGTEAAKMKTKQLPVKTINERSRRLHEVVGAISSISSISSS